MIFSVVPAAEPATARGEKGKGQRRRSGKKPLHEDAGSEEEPQLVLRQGPSDQTPDEMLITYTITWVCKVGGKKVTDDTVGIRYRIGPYFRVV